MNHLVSNSRPKQVNSVQNSAKLDKHHLSCRCQEMHSVCKTDAGFDTPVADAGRDSFLIDRSLACLIPLRWRNVGQTEGFKKRSFIIACQIGITSGSSLLCQSSPCVGWDGSLKPLQLRCNAWRIGVGAPRPGLRKYSLNVQSVAQYQLGVLDSRYCRNDLRLLVLGTSVLAKYQRSMAFCIMAVDDRTRRGLENDQEPQSRKNVHGLQVPIPIFCSGRRIQRRSVFVSICEWRPIFGGKEI